MIQVVGHRNPDSDSICSALAAAEWLKVSRNAEAMAVSQGDITGETAFILHEAGVEAPALCGNVEDQKVWLVDFTDCAQGPEGLDKADIQGVIDHHRLGDLTTVNPLEMWVWPVGCSSTILYNLFRMEGLEIERSVAILMLGAILSDTVAFRSPTCTDKDRQAAQALAEIAGISLYDFTDRLLRAKTNLEGLSIDSLVDRDLKEYTIHSEPLVVGQVEIANFEQVDDKIEALNAELQDRCDQEGFKLASLMLTDITSSTTRLLVKGEWADKLKSDSSAPWLHMENTLSRKKQAWPWMQKTLTS